MANALYPLWKQELLKSTAGTELNLADGATTGVFCVLIDSAVRGYISTDQFYSAMISAAVGTEQEITTKTQALGVFDGTDVTFTSVSGATCEAILIFRKTGGANTAWPLIAYLDTGVTNLPVTPNGGNITITWNASGIFGL